MHFVCLQVGMLGSRFAVLMLFTRIFKQWVLGVIGIISYSLFLHLNILLHIFKRLKQILEMWVYDTGVHWLGATFWMVSQQTDIIKSTGRWRFFNLILGAIHVFLFLNVKYGPSRYRIAGFYLVRLSAQKCSYTLKCSTV